MPFIINVKAISWKKMITLAIISLIFCIIENILISFMIFLSYRKSKQYREMESLEFQEWKAPMEMLLTWLISFQTTCFIFAYAHIDISYEPARNAGLGPLEQCVPIYGSNAEDAATQHAVGKNESQATMLPQRHSMPLKRKSTKLPQRIQVPKQHTMPSTLDNKDNNDDKDDKDDKATAAAPEQPTEAAMGTDMDTDDTADDVKAMSPSPTVFLRRMSTASNWQRETLTQILAISRAGEASEVVPSPEWVSVAILSQERPQIPSPSLRQALNAMRSTLDQTSNEVNNQTPSTPGSITRRDIFTKYHYPSTYFRQPVLGPSASPAPPSASAGFWYPHPSGRWYLLPAIPRSNSARG